MITKELLAVAFGSKLISGFPDTSSLHLKLSVVLNGIEVFIVFPIILMPSEEIESKVPGP